MGSRATGRSWLFCFFAACSPAIAHGEGAERTRPPLLVVEDLLGDDWKAAREARDEMARIGARGAPALIAARREAPPSARRRRPIDEALRGIVRVLAEQVGRPLLEPAERVAADGALGGVLGASDRERPDASIPELGPEAFGDAGSIAAETPQTWFEKQAAARRARGALVALGPPVSGLLLEVPPLREAEHAQALQRIVAVIVQRERARALAAASPPAREAFRASYRGVADLAAPVLVAGLRDPAPRVRALFQQVRDEVLEEAIARLDAPEPPLREAAEEALFRLGAVSRQPLERIAAGKVPGRDSAHIRAAAARLARRIRYGVTPELVRRIGHDFADYARLPFRERRQRVIELERLGGEHAVPALRALLEIEASDSVRTVAAIGLFRLGDAYGAQWLSVHRMGVPLPQISKRDLAAIHMDQGLRYLNLGRFERAEREFKKVLEAEPRNDIAWYNLACTYSRWGKVDEAIEHLRQAVACGFDDVSHMEQDPDLDNIRADPRYRAIIAGIQGEPPAPDGGDDATPREREE